jgi:hypothetical protein
VLKVKVPIIFSGTEGFPARRDGRYALGIPAFAYATNDVEAITKQHRMFNSNYPLNVTKVYMQVLKS